MPRSRPLPVVLVPAWREEKEERTDATRDSLRGKTDSSNPTNNAGKLHGDWKLQLKSPASLRTRDIIARVSLISYMHTRRSKTSQYFFRCDWRVRLLVVQNEELPFTLKTPNFKMSFGGMLSNCCILSKKEEVWISNHERRNHDSCGTMLRWTPPHWVSWNYLSTISQVSNGSNLLNDELLVFHRMKM